MMPAETSSFLYLSSADAPQGSFSFLFSFSMFFRVFLFFFFSFFFSFLFFFFTMYSEIVKKRKEV